MRLTPFRHQPSILCCSPLLMPVDVASSPFGLSIAGRCQPPRCSWTAPFIVPLIVRQARHRSCVIALLFSVGNSGRKGLLLRQTLTLALGMAWAVVPTGVPHTGTRILLITIGSLATSPPTVLGVGGSAGICSLIGPGTQHMSSTNHRHGATVAT